MQLTFDNVWAGYGKFTVLRGVDLTVPEGATVALLGANGAGKTTLLKTAIGLVRPARGRVLLGGRAVERWRPNARARNGLCLIPEGRGIFRLTVRENLAMQLGGGDVADGIDRAAAVFPILRKRLDQVAGTMSGGEQQMLALARALITDAPVVMADELSIGLAPVIVDEIFAAVEALRSVGRSLLIVEQYAERVLPIADYVYLLHKGEVAFVGEPAQCHANAIFEQYLGGAA
jgi:branched-chain amino acid transport system ATP-binding protein